MSNQRIKIINERSPRELEAAVNTFIKELEKEPTKIYFSHYLQNYEGGEQWPRHIAYITYNITK